MKKKNLVVLLIIVFLTGSLNGENTKKLIEYNNFLEISKNYMQVHDVNNKVLKSNKLINNLEMINFSYKPLKRPIKPIDILTVHYAYPLKIFMPKNSTVTKAVLSNSKTQPAISQNMVFVTVDKSFITGLLDIFYIYNNNEKEGKHISIKLDRYMSTSKNINNRVLYTQINYYKSEKLSFQKILASLKPFEYGIKLSQVEYQGVIYDIHLVSIVKHGVVLKRYMDNKYINCSLDFNGREYNYYVQ